jgi:ABC-type phosphate transport system auxiliary subunit
MAKVSKTYGELVSLISTINAVMNNSEHVSENIKGVKKLQKIGERVKSSLAYYNEKLEDLRLDNAHTDEQGCLTLDEKGNYKYSKDGLKNLNKRVKELLDETFEFDQIGFSGDGIENYAFLNGWIDGMSWDIPVIDAEEVD